MIISKHLGGKLGIVLCGTMLGYTTYGQPSVSVGIDVPLPVVEVSVPSVEIHAESDFIEPLTPYGRWEVVGSYGRCWIPGHVEADWRPYSEGYWQRTDAGWYWASDEPWGWATYHYGRWDLSPQFGWYWMPQTVWAPAWVSWHTGGGYMGWAPLQPAGVVVISPRAYVFVEERHFMEPVRRSTLVVNNTTIINKTVIHEAPATATIEKASGRKIQAVPVQEARHKEEAAVVSRQRAPAAGGAKEVQTPARGGAETPAKRTIAEPAQPAVEKATAPAREPGASAPRGGRTPVETDKSAPAAADSKPAARPEPKAETSRPAAGQEPGGQSARGQRGQAEQSAPSQGRGGQQPAGGRGGPGQADKDPQNKSKP